MFNSISWQTKCFQSSGLRRLASTTSNTKARHHCQTDLLWCLQRTLTFTHIFLHFSLSLSLLYTCFTISIHAPSSSSRVSSFLPIYSHFKLFHFAPIFFFFLPPFSLPSSLFMFSSFPPFPALSLSSSSFDGLVVGGTDSARLELLSQCEMCCCGDDMSHFTLDWWCVWEGAREGERALEYREWGSGEFTKCYRSMRTIGYRWSCTVMDGWENEIRRE